MKVQTTILRFVPDIPSKQIENDSPEIVQGKPTHTRESAQKRATRKLRKHFPQGKTKEKHDWKFGTLMARFKKKSLTSVDDVYVLKEDSSNAELRSGSSSRSIEDETNRAIVKAPLSLVEQRKDQLEDFLAAHAQKTQKNTPPTVPSPHVKDQPCSEKSLDPSEKQSKIVLVECKPGSVCQGMPSTTNSVQSRTRQSAINPKATSFDKESTSNQGSERVSAFTSSTAAQMSPSSQMEAKKKRSMFLMRIKEDANENPVRGDTPSMTSSLSLTTVPSKLHDVLGQEGETPYEEKCYLDPHCQNHDDSSQLSVGLDVQPSNGTECSSVSSTNHSNTMPSNNDDKDNKSEEVLLLQTTKSKTIRSEDIGKISKISNRKQQRQQHQDTDDYSPKRKSRRSKSSSQNINRGTFFDGKWSSEKPKLSLSRRRQNTTSLFVIHQENPTSPKQVLSESERRRKERKALLSTTLF
jgi:hypothetical protein